MPLHRKIAIVFADNYDWLIISSDLVRFEHVLCFSTIEGSITP